MLNHFQSQVSVRKRAMIKLLELYHAYCVKCSEGLLPITDHFEQIPSKILTLCFDKDCKEFRFNLFIYLNVPHN